MMSGPRPALACGAAPTIGSPYTTPASPACSATWVATEAACSGRRRPRPACTTSPPDPAPRSTATWNGSTASRSTWCHLTTPGTAARSTGPPHREPARVAAYARAKQAKTEAWSETVASRRWGCGPTPRVTSDRPHPGQPRAVVHRHSAAQRRQGSSLLLRPRPAARPPWPPWRGRPPRGSLRRWGRDRPAGCR
jgi:hypothetical protein